MALFGSLGGHTSHRRYGGESGFATYGLMRCHPVKQAALAYALAARTVNRTRSCSKNAILAAGMPYQP